MRLAMKIATSRGARLFRRNVGMAWAGEAVKFSGRGQVSVEAGDVLVKQARPFRSAITGQADLTGWVPVTITAEMVGMKLAIVTEVEVKKDSRVTAEQRAWLNAVLAAGGIAGVVRNEDELVALLVISHAPPQAAVAKKFVPKANV